MSQFHHEKLDMFLGVVRKYMQVRGGLSQKDLSDITEVGVSTMSRFLNKKSTDINPQLVAKIAAKLEIPLHEIIDFVEEDYADRFIRLVKFYKSFGDEALLRKDDEISEDEVLEMRSAGVASSTGDELDDLARVLTPNGGSQMSAKGNISVGGKKRTLVFEPDQNPSSNSISDKIASLSGKHRAFMKDFLNLQQAEKDLVVDISNDLIIYFRHKGVSV